MNFLSWLYEILTEVDDKSLPFFLSAMTSDASRCHFGAIGGCQCMETISSSDCKVNFPGSAFIALLAYIFATYIW